MEAGGFPYIRREELGDGVNAPAVPNIESESFGFSNRPFDGLGVGRSGGGICTVVPSNEIGGKLHLVCDVDVEPLITRTQLGLERKALSKKSRSNFAISSGVAVSQRLVIAPYRATDCSCKRRSGVNVGA